MPVQDRLGVFVMESLFYLMQQAVPVSNVREELRRPLNDVTKPDYDLLQTRHPLFCVAPGRDRPDVDDRIALDDIEDVMQVDRGIDV